MRVVDLFSGCGGLSQGFLAADYEIVAAFDAWDKAIDIYKRNFQHYAEVRDLSNVDASVNLVAGWRPDFIIGGPPCQDFSHAGPRKEGDRANLTIIFANIVCSVKPTWFVMENVDRIMKSATYKKVHNMFKKYGYGLTEVLLDASLCGVPQKRKRFFCIATLYENDNFLRPFIEELKSDKPMTVRDYIGNSLGVEHYYRHPCNYKRRGVFSIDEPAPTVRGVNRPIPPGYPGHRGDTAPISNQLRQLTTRERALLQTFPENFVFKGSKTNLEQMIGNAVPVNLAKFVAESINNYRANMIIGDDVIIDGGFKTWLMNNKGLKERSAKDVISRTRRASRYVNVRRKFADNDLINLLQKNSEFAQLSKYVRPQIKRAMLLFREYNAMNE